MVYVFTPPPRADTKVRGDATERVRKVLMDYTDKPKFCVYDLSLEFQRVGDTLLSTDGIHVKQEGVWVFAEKIEFLCNLVVKPMSLRERVAATSRQPQAPASFRSNSNSYGANFGRPWRRPGRFFRGVDRGRFTGHRGQYGQVPLLDGSGPGAYGTAGGFGMRGRRGHFLPPTLPSGYAGGYQHQQQSYYAGN
jgi:hypothetical protein